MIWTKASWNSTKDFCRRAWGLKGVGGQTLCKSGRISGGGLSWALIIDIRFTFGPDPMMLCWLLGNQFLVYNIAFTRLAPVGFGDAF